MSDSVEIDVFLNFVNLGGGTGGSAPPQTPSPSFSKLNFISKILNYHFGTSLYYSRRLKLLQMYFNLIE